MPTTFPTVEQIKQLPHLLEIRIPPEYEDLNGHMNVQHYLSIFDMAGMPFMSLLGIDEKYFKVQRQGFFDLEHHLHYRAEVHVGDTVGIYGRLLARTTKRFHGIWFMVNETHQQLASTFEFVTTHADLEARRTSPLTDMLTTRLDTMLQQQSRLDWDAPICGVMSA